MNIIYHKIIHSYYTYIQLIMYVSVHLSDQTASIRSYYNDFHSMILSLNILKGLAVPYWKLAAPSGGSAPLQLLGMVNFDSGGGVSL